jgi:hypothetical protein|tara:strand:+ start:1322 stop:1687 length:366 start_codon:yes stop_codon:yes gene_type:complete
MTKILLGIVISIILTGCSDLLKREELILTKEVFVEKIPLELSMPEPVQWNDFKFIVVTPDNYEKVITRLKSEGKSVALFAVDHPDYESLSKTIIDMKRYIGDQKLIIIEYKNYYEPLELQN